MRHFLLPSKHNNFTPHLLHRTALIIYVLVIFVFNLSVGQLSQNRSYAAVDAGTLYSLHNSNRSANGLSGLTVNSQLVSSATSKAQAMLNADCWSHYCPPGTSPWSFILGAGYQYVYAGENLGEGFTNSSTLMNAWMNSSSHRANVLNSNFTEIGIGFAYGEFQGNPNNTIVVVHFGSRGTTSPTATPVPPKQISNNSPQSPSQPNVPIGNNPVVNPTDVPDVKINNPENNSFTNDPKPKIVGSKPIDSELDILIDNKSVGKVDSGGGNFSFRPGEKLEDGKKSLEAKAYINGVEVSTSNKVNFTIDTEVPEIEEESIQINYADVDEDVITLSLKTLSNANTVKTNISNLDFEKREDGTWVLSLNKENLPEGSSLILTAKDKAGNTSVLEIPGEEILGYFDHNLFLSQEFDPNTITGSAFSGSSILTNLLNGEVKSIVNFIFLMFLFVLFALDFYILHKSGLTGVQRNKSHLNMSLTAIILIVLLLGVSGSII